MAPQANAEAFGDVNEEARGPRRRRRFWLRRALGRGTEDQPPPEDSDRGPAQVSLTLQLTGRFILGGSSIVQQRLQGPKKTCEECW